MINVLIVDDDPMVAELNRRYLEQIDDFCWQGSVSTLQAAKQRLQENSPAIDLVLLDIYMQKDNGLWICYQRSAGCIMMWISS